VDDGTAAIRDQAVEVGRGWSGPTAPPSWALTASLFECLADDRDLLELAATIPPDRLPALVFVAGVNALVRAHPDDALATYFPFPDRDRRAVDTGFATTLHAFCIERRDELTSTWAGRTYQMNEVARCAQVALALAEIERAGPGRRVGLVDVGTGAGLGLYVDRYRYRFSDGTALGEAESTVQVDCDVLRGRLPAEPLLPSITRRVGLDLHPVDLADPDAAAWLAACIPPEPGAVARFAAASALVAAAAPRLVAGGAIEALPALLDELASADDVDLVVVIDSYTAVFFDDDDLARFRQIMTRPTTSAAEVAWVSLDPLVPLGTEASRTVQGVEAPTALVDANRAGGVFAVLSVQLGRADPRILATAHPSGTRLTWLDVESTQADRPPGDRRDA
jgi:hypothetical protein